MTPGDYKKNISIGFNGSNLIRKQSGTDAGKYYGMLAIRVVTARNNGSTNIRLANGSLDRNLRFRHTSRSNEGFRDSSIFTIKFKTTDPKELFKPLGNCTAIQNDTSSNLIWNVIRTKSGDEYWTVSDPRGSFCPSIRIQPPAKPNSTLDGYPFLGSYNIYAQNISDGYNDQYTVYLPNTISDSDRIVGSFLNLTVTFWVNIPNTKPIDWDSINALLQSSAPQNPAN